MFVCLTGLCPSRSETYAYGQTMTINLLELRWVSFELKMTSHLTLPLRVGTIDVAQVLLYCPLWRPLLLRLLCGHFTFCGLFTSSLLVWSVACKCRKEREREKLIYPQNTVKARTPSSDQQHT